MEERDEYVEGQQHTPAWFFILVWLGWVIATVAGYLAGQWLSESIAGALVGDSGVRVLSIEGRVQPAGVVGYIVALIGGGAAGLVLGLAQAVILLPFIKKEGTVEWLLATVLGRATQWLIIYGVGTAMAGIVIDKNLGGISLLFAILAATGILSGAALGYPQSQVFKRRAHGVGWLLFTNMLAPLITSVILGMTLLIEAQDTMRDYATLLTAILLAVASSFAMQELLHHPRSGAEWVRTLSWRTPQRRRRLASDTVLGSELYAPRPRVDAGVTPASAAPSPSPDAGPEPKSG